MPKEDELAQLEGLNIPGMSVEDEEPVPPENYLSDTGAEITKATQELDEFQRIKKGRHGKEDMKKMRMIEHKVYRKVRELEIQKGEASASDEQVPSLSCDEELEEIKETNCQAEKNKKPDLFEIKKELPRVSPFSL